MVVGVKTARGAIDEEEGVEDDATEGGDAAPAADAPAAE